MEKVWLAISYPVDYTFGIDGLWSWGIDQGDTYMVLVPKNISFVDLYHKLEQKLKIDTSIHEMVLRCPYPITSKIPLQPVLVNDDETVNWLMSCWHEVSLCVSLKLKTNILYDKVGGLENGQIQPQVLMNNEVTEYVDVDDSSDGVNVNGDSLMNDEVTEYVGVDDSPDGVNVNGDSLMNDEVTEYGGVDDSQERVDVSDDYLIPGAFDNLMTDIGVDAGDVSLTPCEITGNMTVEEVNAIELPGLINVDRRDVGFIASCEPMLCTGRIPEGEDIRLGECFDSKRRLKDKVELLAVRFNFVFVSKKSNKTTFTVQCKNEECKWLLSANCVGDLKMFQVKTYECPHSCSYTMHKKDHRHASYKMIARLYVDRFQDPRRVYKMKDIIHDFKQQFGYTLSRTKAHNAKIHAKELIQGNPKKSFAKLPMFFHALELANPGTLTFIETQKASFFKTVKGKTTQTEVDDVFLYCFMALGQCIKGFKSSIRPVISVDGTFLKGRYKGTLVVATCQDGNYQIYPLAWGIVDSENNKSWTWSFEKLKMIIGDTSDVAIISDRVESIKHGFQAVYNNACHEFCTYHLKKNLKTNFPKYDLDELFNKASRAYTVGEFRSYFDALCLKNEAIRGSLDEESFRYWARAHFDGSRYNIMTTNNAESVNNLLKSIRYLPLVGLLKGIRDILQRWFAERHARAHDWDKVVTPKIEKEIMKRYNHMQRAAPKVNLVRVGQRFEVLVDELSYIVDLDLYTCTCRRFDLDKIPCLHAIATTKEEEKEFYLLCNDYYSSSFWKEAYSEFISPVPNEAEIEFPIDVLNRKVVAPPLKNERGRPSAEERQKSAGEVRGLKERKAATKKRKMEATKKSKMEGADKVLGKKREEPMKKDGIGLGAENKTKKKRKKPRKKLEEVEKCGETSTVMIKPGEKSRRIQKYASIQSLTK